MVGKGQAIYAKAVTAVEFDDIREGFALFTLLSKVVVSLSFHNVVIIMYNSALS